MNITDKIFIVKKNVLMPALLLHDTDANIYINTRFLMFIFHLLLLSSKPIVITVNRLLKTMHKMFFKIQNLSCNKERYLVQHCKLDIFLLMAEP